jgi:hypothetical protein
LLFLVGPVLEPVLELVRVRVPGLVQVPVSHKPPPCC